MGPHSSRALMWKALETARVSSGWAGLAEKAVLNNKTIIVHLVCRRITAQVEFLERKKKGKHLEDRLPFLLQKFYSTCPFLRQPLCAHEQVFSIDIFPLK